MEKYMDKDTAKLLYHTKRPIRGKELQLIDNECLSDTFRILNEQGFYLYQFIPHENEILVEANRVSNLTNLSRKVL